MRKIVIAVVLLHLSLFALGQVKTDESLNAYIQKEGYINLTDVDNLPYIIKFHQPLITQDLLMRNENPADYYVRPADYKLTNETIRIALYHIKGLKKHQEKEVLVFGNTTGKDGEIVINYNEMKVKNFYLSQ